MANGHATASEIITRAARGLGLRSDTIADPYAETDENIIRLCEALRRCGQILVRKYAWSHLKKTHTFSTSAGIDYYAYPADFVRIINQTIWNRTLTRRVLGPLNHQQWELLQAQSTSGTVDSAFSIFGGYVNLYPLPQATETIAFAYVSSWWEYESDEVIPSGNNPSAGADYIAFDPELMVAGTELIFKELSGFDTAAAEGRFLEALTQAQGGDGASPILDIAGGNSLDVRMLDYWNLPETGYGS